MTSRQSTVVDLAHAFSQFHEHWTPHIVAELNGQQVKVARLLGEFEWHTHKDEDELFWIISGVLELHFRDQIHTLHPGQMLVVPRGVEHRPVCREEVKVVLFEPASTINTGGNVSDLTQTELKRL